MRTERLLVALLLLGSISTNYSCQKKMTDKKRWVITTSGQRPLGEIAGELAAKGFATDSVLEEIGCITGTATDDVADKLRQVSGVEDVSPEPQINIGPPGSETTW